MHIGMIMDGNRRWAKEKNKLTFFGHTAGFKKAEEMVKIVCKKGISHFTLWALSKENLVKRSEEELTGIFKLLNSLFDFLPVLIENNIVFKTIGDIGKLPIDTQKILKELKEKTTNNTGMIFTIALVYSGQDEIVRATKKILNAGINPDDLDESIFRTYLDVATLPKIDLIIRTGIHNGTDCMRHSGFMLYDCAYSEYYFTHTLWPDFDEIELNKSLESYEKTKRTLGK